MNSNLSRDANLLLRIYRNQFYIIGVLENFKCDFSQTDKGVMSNKSAFDLCVFYTSQIAGDINKLTKGSKLVVGPKLNFNALSEIRNLREYTYDKQNKVSMQAYIQQVVSDDALSAVAQRREYCIKHRR